MRGLGRRLVAVGVLLMLFAGGASSCVLLVAHHTVGHDFVVIAKTRDGERMQNAPVKIYSGSGKRSQVAMTATTDRNGQAEVRNLPQGEYEIEVEGEWGHSERATLEVNPYSANQKRVVELEWLQEKPFRVRSLSGRFQEYSEPLAKARLTLLDRKTKQVIATQRTNAEGEFDFRVTRAADYLLRIQRKNESDELNVSLDPTAERGYLQLEITFSTCGTMFDDIVECGVSTVRTGARTGQILDPMGAVISGAKVQLYPATLDDVANEPPLESVYSDDVGRFALRASRGEYLLTVAAPNFKTWRTRFLLEDSDNSETLVVSMYVGGMKDCSQGVVVAAAPR